MNKKYFFFGLFIIFVAGFLFYKASVFIKVDRCLDAGGSWNKEKALCEKDEQYTQEDLSPRVGGDKDSRGCIPSAGMVWSSVKSSCVQPFSVGVSLMPVQKQEGDAIFVAYLIESATTTQTLSPGKVVDSFPTEVEVYIPDQKESLILKREGVEGSYVWKNSSYSAEMAKNGWVLKKSTGSVLFAQ